MRMKPFLLGVILAALGGAIAHADPCEAPVRGYPVGAVVSGSVRYVGDGDMLCVGATANPSSWVEVRLSNWFAPELNQAGGIAARDLLRERAMGRSARCVVERGRDGRTYNYDRLIARCAVGGRDIASLMYGQATTQGGRGWRGR